MKQRIIVKQKNQITNEEFLMADGMCEIRTHENKTEVSYHELDAASTKVEIFIHEDQLKIVRHGEVLSTLYFRTNEKTYGTVSNEFGEFQIELYTHRYLCGKETIAVEYDVLSGDAVSDSFRILWKMRRDDA